MEASVAGYPPPRAVRGRVEPAAGLLDLDDRLVQPAPGDVGHDDDQGPAVGWQRGLGRPELGERGPDHRCHLPLRLDEHRSRPSGRPRRRPRCGRSTAEDRDVGGVRQPVAQPTRAWPGPHRPWSSDREGLLVAAGSTERGRPRPPGVVLGEARREVDRGQAALGQRRPRVGEAVGRRHRQGQPVVPAAQVRADEGRVIGPDPGHRRQPRPQRVGRLGDPGRAAPRRRRSPPGPPDVAVDERDERLPADRPEGVDVVRQRGEVAGRGGQLRARGAGRSSRSARAACRRPAAGSWRRRSRPRPSAISTASSSQPAAPRIRRAGAGRDVGGWPPSSGQAGHQVGPGRPVVERRPLDAGRIGRHRTSDRVRLLVEPCGAKIPQVAGHVLRLEAEGRVEPRAVRCCRAGAGAAGRSRPGTADPQHARTCRPPAGSGGSASARSPGAGHRPADLGGDLAIRPVARPAELVLARRTCAASSRLSPDGPGEVVGGERLESAPSVAGTGTIPGDSGRGRPRC